MSQVYPHKVAAEIIAGKSPIYPEMISSQIYTHISCTVHIISSRIACEPLKAKRRLMLERTPEIIRDKVKERVIFIFSNRAS